MFVLISVLHFSSPSSCRSSC